MPEGEGRWTLTGPAPAGTHLLRASGLLPAQALNRRAHHFPERGNAGQAAVVPQDGQRRRPAAGASNRAPRRLRSIPLDANAFGPCSPACQLGAACPRRGTARAPRSDRRPGTRRRSGEPTPLSTADGQPTGGRSPSRCSAARPRALPRLGHEPAQCARSDSADDFRLDGVAWPARRLQPDSTVTSVPQALGAAPDPARLRPRVGTSTEAHWLAAEAPRWLCPRAWQRRPHRRPNGPAWVAPLGGGHDRGPEGLTTGSTRVSWACRGSTSRRQGGGDPHHQTVMCPGWG